MFGLFNKDKKNVTKVDVSNRTVVRVLILTVLTFFLLLALRRAEHALLLVFTAFFLALALNAPVHWLAGNLPGKRRGNRLLATTVSFLIVVVIIGGLLTLVIPPLVKQTNNFIHEAPGLVQGVKNENNSLGKFIKRYHLENEVNKISSQVSDRLHNISGTVLATVSRLVSSIFSMLAILGMTFMMLAEGPYWVEKLRRILPQSQIGHVDKLASDMYRVIKGYVNGQVLLALIAAALLTPALFILHIADPLALMFIVFLAALIPLIGHPIGAVIVSIVALFHSPWSALVILLYYILYMQIENYVIQPHIQSNTTNLSPLLVFMSVVIGVSFGGLFGGLVAIPVAGCLRVVVVYYLHESGKLDELSPTKKS